MSNPAAATSEHWTIHAVNLETGEQTRTAGSRQQTHRQHLNTSAAKTAGHNNAEWHGHYSREDNRVGSLSWEADLVIPARRGTGWTVLGVWQITREPRHPDNNRHRHDHKTKKQARRRKQPAPQR